MKTIRFAFSVIMVIAAGCDSGNDVTAGDYVIQPHLNTPPEQSLPGQVFEDVTIRVTNHDSDPLRNITVNFSGDGTVEPATAVTGADGTVQVRWALPATPIVGVSAPAPTGPPGEYRLIAQVGAESLTLPTSAHAFKVDKVDAGFGHACGIVSQVLWCWGPDLNTWTTLPPTAQYAMPVEFASLGPVTNVAVSTYSVCVLNTSGMPLCSAGATGKVFSAVAGAPELLDLFDGDAYFCGRARDLTAWCWYTRGATPMQAVQISNSLQFTSIGAGGGQTVSVEAGGFGCGLTGAGEVWCWGRNHRGQLGDGTSNDSPAPVLVSGGHVFSQLEVTYATSCAVAASYQIWCWGFRGPMSTQSNVPVLMNFPGGTGPLMALGEFEAYVQIPAGKRMWYQDQAWDIGLDGLGLDRISADGQMCALTQTGEAYCSWILVYGGGDSFVTPGGVVAVPRPGTIPQPPSLRAATSHYSPTTQENR
jgi:hypothetical protein